MRLCTTLSTLKAFSHVSGVKNVTATTAAAALFAVSSSSASTGDGWRWPRYDNKPVRVHIVADVSVDAWLTNVLRNAAKAWEASGELRFDFPRPVKDCAAVTRLNTVCVSVDEGQACGNAAGCFDPGPAAGIAADGLSLFAYSRAWIRGDHGPDADLRILCHELGHAIGLGHTEDGPDPSASCMANSGELYSSSPSRDDLAFVHALYSVRDTR